MFTRAQINETLEQMSYNPSHPLGAITKNGFIKPWQYLITQIGACFPKRIINHHEASYRLMEPVRALILDTPYNFSYYLIKDFASNLWSGKPFLVYPRFLIRIITSQLGFGGVPTGFPRAEMRLQQNMNLNMLIPTNQNSGLMTERWLLFEMIHGEGMDLD
ncbi:hypothetical protein Hanom_Chr15g01382271 [Helianthus anomalus]